MFIHATNGWLEDSGNCPKSITIRPLLIFDADFSFNASRWRTKVKDDFNTYLSKYFVYDNDLGPEVTVPGWQNVKIRFPNNIPQTATTTEKVCVCSVITQGHHATYTFSREVVRSTMDFNPKSCPMRKLDKWLVGSNWRSLSCAFPDAKVPLFNFLSTLQATPISGPLPPDSAIISYATEGALLIFAHLSNGAVSALRKVWVQITLQASLSGTFLQTLPETGYVTVTCHPPPPPKGLDTNGTESNMASEHARKHEARPLRVKQMSSVSIQTSLVLFVMA